MDTPSWQVGVGLNSHIYSTVQRLHSVPTTWPGDTLFSSVHVWKVFFLKSGQCGNTELKAWSLCGLATVCC